MTETQVFDLPDEAATQLLGRALANQDSLSGLIFLHGELGAGKTTLVRAYLKALGHPGPVKSPTYTLIEPYQLADGRRIYHLDLYRLSGVEELEYLGLQDLMEPGCTLLVEWPERAAGYLVDPVMDITLTYQGQGRQASCASDSPGLLKILAETVMA